VQMPASYWGKESFFGTETPLPEGAGYAILLGFGAFFSLLTTLLEYVDKWANNTRETSEYFKTAGRSVKTGLAASVIVSQCTWAATLLQSSNVAWNLVFLGSSGMPAEPPSRSCSLVSWR